MLALGIESTAHTFGAAIVSSEKEVLANCKDSFTTESGGMLPAKVADHHVICFNEVINKALDEAGVTMGDIGLIAFSQSPGIGHTLRIGALVARTLALKNDIPIIGVNHCIAHLEIGFMLFDVKDPVLLYASGANTQIIAYEGGKFRIFGETLDIGIGNLLDSVAREMGLGFPGGPKISALADKSTKLIELPYAVKGMDVSFGGIQTNIKQKIQKGVPLEDLAFSLQETIFAMLIEVSERALAHCEKDELILGGGVACNTRLKEMAQKMCEARGARCFIPENQFLVDNAAMIAWLGILQGTTMRIPETIVKPYERTDEVLVTWR